jgi:hypothetical protein
MICYICAEHATNSVRVHDTLTVSYCDKHSQEAAIGISEFALKGTLDRLEGFKAEYLDKFHGSATTEFEKCKTIEKFLEGEDFGIEQHD